MMITTWRILWIGSPVWELAAGVPADAASARTAPASATPKSLLYERIACREAAAKCDLRGADLARIVPELGDDDLGSALRHHRRQCVDRRSQRVEHEVAGGRNPSAQRDLLGIDEGDDVGQTDG